MKNKLVASAFVLGFLFAPISAFADSVTTTQGGTPSYSCPEGSQIVDTDKCLLPETTRQEQQQVPGSIIAKQTKGVYNYVTCSLWNYSGNPQYALAQSWCNGTADPYDNPSYRFHVKAKWSNGYEQSIGTSYAYPEGVYLIGFTSPPVYDNFRTCATQSGQPCSVYMVGFQGNFSTSEVCPENTTEVSNGCQTEPTIQTVSVPVPATTVPATISGATNGGSLVASVSGFLTPVWNFLASKLLPAIMALVILAIGVRLSIKAVRKYSKVA